MEVRIESLRLILKSQKIKWRREDMKWGRRDGREERDGSRVLFFGKVGEIWTCLYYMFITKSQKWQKGLTSGQSSYSQEGRHKATYEE